MLPPSRYPRQRLLIILTLAAGLPAALVQGVFAFVGDDSWGRALVAFGALMLPPVFIAWRLAGDASRQALGLVLAYAGLFAPVIRPTGLGRPIPRTSIISRAGRRRARGLRPTPAPPSSFGSVPS